MRNAGDWAWALVVAAFFACIAVMVWQDEVTEREKIRYGQGCTCQEVDETETVRWVSMPEIEIVFTVHNARHRRPGP